jgi:hypothetical protein
MVGWFDSSIPDQLSDILIRKYPMKTTFAIFALASLSFAQDKTPPANLVGGASPTERNLTEAEALKLQLLAARAQIIQDKYKIQQFQEEMKPITDEQSALAAGLCRSVGIPAELVQTQCSLNLGVDQNGRPIVGADGKPATPRVWWNRPAPAPVTPEKK